MRVDISGFRRAIRKLVRNAEKRGESVEWLEEQKHTPSDKRKVSIAFTTWIDEVFKDEMEEVGFTCFESYMNGEQGYSFINLKTGECISIRMEDLDEEILDTYREMAKEKEG